MEATNYIGQPASRQDGRAKVTGSAPYAAEFNVPDLAYGVVVNSPIARGRIRHLDAEAVENLPGVLRVFSHKNVSGLAWLNMSYTDMDAPPGHHFRFLQSDEISFSMQPVAHLDPLALRLQNYSHTDGMTGKPYSSKALRACYEQAASRFGWRERTPEPRSMRADNGQLLGWGLATGIWESLFMPSRAKAVLTADGKLTVSSGSADIGTGTYPIMSQIAAE